MVTSVCFLEPFILELSLSSGSSLFFDVSPYFTLGDFYLLKDLEEFKNFAIDEGGIAWDCGVSLSWDTILKHSYK